LGEAPVLVRCVFTAVLVICGLCVAIAAELPIRKGQEFGSARSALVRAGWKPIETFTALEGEPERLHFGAGEVFRAGFKEIESCMGTGNNPCFYNYQRGDRCLFLITEGEYEPLRRMEPKVTAWFLYPVPVNRVSASRPQFPFCSEDAANKTRQHIIRPC
jgi:hypothetical protein